MRFDHDWLNRRIIEEVMDKESHRRTALFFCAGVEHSRHVCEEIRRAAALAKSFLGNTDNAKRRPSLRLTSVRDLGYLQ